MKKDVYEKEKVTKSQLAGIGFLFFFLLLDINPTASALVKNE